MQLYHCTVTKLPPICPIYIQVDVHFERTLQLDLPEVINSSLRFLRFRVNFALIKAVYSIQLFDKGHLSNTQVGSVMCLSL